MGCVGRNGGVRQQPLENSGIWASDFLTESTQSPIVLQREKCLNVTRVTGTRCGPRLTLRLTLVALTLRSAES
jgi:hypothetical protein